MVATKEQSMGSTQDHHHHQYPQPHLLSVKGKRTKRPPRTTGSPPALTTNLSPSSASASYTTGTDDEGRVTTNTATSSTTTTTSAEYPYHISRSTTNAEEEEEDMANCLILLAHSSTNKNNTATATQKLTAISSSRSRRRRQQQQQQSTVSVAVTIPKLVTTTTANMMGSASTASAGIYSYECKTCNRCFPSFQALGGHRASHKKSKLPPPTDFDRKQLSLSPFSDEGQSNDYNYSSLSLQIGTCNNNNHHPTNAASATPNSSSTIPLMSNKPKVHECTICGAEFSSGQALGGHMRRHRALLTGTGTTTTTTSPAPAVSAMHPMMIGATPMVHKIQNSIEEREDEKRTRNLLSLDLNLPAPEDDPRGDQQQQQSKFVFKSNDNTLFFSGSSLVDCHH